MHKITAENKGPLANLCGCVLAVWDQPPCRHGEWHKLYTVIKCAPARLTAHTGEENEVSLWSRRLKVGKKRSKLKRDGCCTCLENCSQTIPYKRKVKKYWHASLFPVGSQPCRGEPLVGETLCLMVSLRLRMCGLCPSLSKDKTGKLFTQKSGTVNTVIMLCFPIYFDSLPHCWL